MAVHCPRKSNCCQICGGFPAGIHFGGLSCEGCRAFFKRNVEKGPNLRCYFGKNCELKLENVEKKDRSKFTTCKACRFQKCLEQGMNPEAVTRAKAAAEKIECEKDMSTPITDGIQENSLSHSVFASGNISDTKMFLPGVVSAGSSVVSLGGASAVTTTVTTNAACVPPQLTNTMRFGSLMVASNSAQIPSWLEKDLPLTLMRYQSILSERDSFFLETAKAVEHAALRCFHLHMTPSVVPDESVAMRENSVIVMNGAALLENRKNHAVSFAMLLPGYSLFESLRNRHTILDRCSEIFDLHSVSAEEQDAMCGQCGPKKAQICRYSKQLGTRRECTRTKTCFFKELENVDLVMTERYVLLAALLFKPRVLDASCADSCTLNTLYFLYMNILEYLIRSRLVDAESKIESLQRLVDRLVVYQTRQTPTTSGSALSILANAQLTLHDKSD